MLGCRPRVRPARSLSAPTNSFFVSAPDLQCGVWIFPCLILLPPQEHAPVSAPNAASFCRSRVYSFVHLLCFDFRFGRGCPIPVHLSSISRDKAALQNQLPAQEFFRPFAGLLTSGNPTECSCLPAKIFPCARDFLIFHSSVWGVSFSLLKISFLPVAESVDLSSWSVSTPDSLCVRSERSFFVSSCLSLASALFSCSCTTIV